MAANQQLSDYNQGLELAQAGEYEQALALITRHLVENPVDAEALNDMGVILHCLGRDDEAIYNFLRSKSIRPGNVQLLLNLCEAYSAAGKIEEIVDLLDELEDAGILHPELLNRTANTALEHDFKEEAIELLLKSIRMWPEQTVLVPMIEIIRTKNQKIAFVSDTDQLQSEFGGVFGYLKDRYCVKFFDAAEMKSVDEISVDADIVWLNNCPAAACRIGNRGGQYKIIADFTKSEISQSLQGGIDWNNIDVIFVNDRLAVPSWVGDKVVELNYGFDVQDNLFVNRSKGKNIVCFDRLGWGNNPMLLVQCMQKLSYVDREYKLFFAGGWASHSVERYVKNMISRLQIEDVIVFEKPGDNLQSFLADKHYVASASCDVAGLENVLFGMACGMKPLVHNFPRSYDILGEEYIYNIAEDFCNMVFSEWFDSERYRFVSNKISGNNNKFSVIKQTIKKFSEQNNFVSQSCHVSASTFGNNTCPNDRI